MPSDWMAPLSLLKVKNGIGNVDNVFIALKFEFTDADAIVVEGENEIKVKPKPIYIYLTFSKFQAIGNPIACSALGNMHC